MNIMFLIYSFNTGGIERQLIEMSNVMIREQQEVFLCVINKDYTDYLFDELDSRVHIVKFDKKPGRSTPLPYMLRLARLIRKRHIDILHCQGINCVIFSALARIASPKMAILNTVHDSGNYPSYSRGKIFVQNRICDMTIAISRTVEKEILARGLSSSCVTTIYNAINTTKFQPLAAVEKADEGIRQQQGRRPEGDWSEQSDKCIRICNVARFYPPKKGQDLLVQATEQLLSEYPDLICYFAGGPANGKDQEAAYIRLQEEIRQKGLEQHFVFAGDIKDVPAFLSDKDIFVLPSRYEGFGISLIEAMAMGMPVVASRLDGPEEIVRDESLGELFAPGNADDLAAKLRMVIEKLPSYDHAKIRKYVCEHYSITSMVGQHLQLYQRLLDDKRR